MILMLAPAPSMTFGAAPSGAAYVADGFSLIKITNDSAADQTFLQGAGCYTLSPFGGWGTFGFTLLADLYSADHGALVPGITGFPRYVTVNVFSDSGNTGTWVKTGTGNGSGNWTQVSTQTLIMAATSAAAAAASETAAAGYASAAAASAAAVGNYPNGMMQRLLTSSVAAGSNLSSTVQTGLRNFEYQIRQMQLASFFIRLTTQLGNDAAAVRIPFIQRPGVGYSSDTGTIGSWTEASGLVNATLDTGVTLAAAGLDAFNVMFGCYNLADPNGAGSDYVVGRSADSWGLYPDTTGVDTTTSSGFFAWDYAGRILGTPQRATTGAAKSGAITKGPMTGFRRPDCSGGIMSCDYPLLDGNNTNHPAYYNPKVMIAEPTTTIQVKALSTWPIGGYWIADAMPEAAIVAFHRIYHDLQVAVGRGVSTEGY
ncbi:hypothetical protein BH10PSE14_BH10PSE14_06880 [soil metagenome]